MDSTRVNNAARIVSVAACVYLVAFGAAMALLPIRPFWNDEWRLIYNIKFKSIGQLWGRLDLLQECPRAYLSLLKYVAAAGDYSYTALRLPPLIIGLASIFLVFYLRRKLYSEGKAMSYLLVLLFVSSQTFTDYLVQVKQYEMDLLLSLIALWQLHVLVGLPTRRIDHPAGYILLCLSFLLLPYLSYTYPIVAAPMYLVWLLLSISQFKNPASRPKTANILRGALPLMLAAISIFIFYQVDVKNMMGDDRMYVSYQRAYYHSQKETFAGNFWYLFALAGSGFIFELIFGTVGIAAFIYNIWALAKKKPDQYTVQDYFRFYAITLIIVVCVLFATGKLIGGVARLTCYSIPSIAVLIITFLESFLSTPRYKKAVAGLAAVIFLGLTGNIVSTCINNFTYPEYRRRIETYRNTQAALQTARARKAAFLATDGVCGDVWQVNAPSQGRLRTNTITREQILGADTLCAEVIVKVNPGYKVWDTITFFYMPDDRWISEYVRQVPDSFKTIVAGDGLRYHIFRRSNRQ